MIIAAFIDSTLLFFFSVCVYCQRLWSVVMAAMVWFGGVVLLISIGCDIPPNPPPPSLESRDVLYLLCRYRAHTVPDGQTLIYSKYVARTSSVLYVYIYHYMLCSISSSPSSQ